MAVSNEMSSNKLTRGRSGSRHNTAFLVEALVVLAFLMVSLAVFVQLFSKAQLEGLSANRLSEAVLIATNRAEEFSANPTAVPEQTNEEDLVVRCDVTPTKRDAGTLYDATITVLDGNEEVYTLHTSRYVATASAASSNGGGTR